MRKPGRFEAMPGRTRIEEIQIDVKSRDDIPAILLGLQELYLNESLRTAIFELLEERFGEDCNLGVGRPGMELWTILVLAVVKQGLGCDFDRLREHANTHVVLRQLLGHSEFDPLQYSYDQILRNVPLLGEDMLRAISEQVVRHGRHLCGHQSDERLSGRCDSFVVETDVHYPTDRNLLWDAARVMVRIAAALAKEWNLPGWRQSEHHQRTLRQRVQRVASTRRSDAWRADVDAFPGKCEELLAKAEATRNALAERGARPEGIGELDRYIAHTKRRIEQTDRRILQGEAIPQEEKVVSVFEEHTRWYSKGKAGVPVEFGVPVAIVEDQYRFLLEHHILWEGNDTDVALPLITAAQECFPELLACSFDRGFHSPDNQAALGDRLERNAMPVKGRRSARRRALEEQPDFAEARQQHPAVESAINNRGERRRRVCDRPGPQPPSAGADRACDAPFPVPGRNHRPTIAAVPLLLLAHANKLVTQAPGDRQGRSPARIGRPPRQGQSALPGDLPAGIHPPGPEALRGVLLRQGRRGKPRK